jgi:hypothetical protein
VEATYSEQDKTIYVHLRGFWVDEDPCRIIHVMKNDDEEVPVKKAKSFQIKNFWLR